VCISTPTRCTLSLSPEAGGEGSGKGLWENANTK